MKERLKKIIAKVAAVLGLSPDQVPLNDAGALALSAQQAAELARLSGQNDIVEAVNTALAAATEDSAATTAAANEETTVASTEETAATTAAAKKETTAATVDAAVEEALDRAASARMAEMNARIEALSAAPVPVPATRAAAPADAPLIGASGLFPGVALGGDRGKVFAAINAFGPSRPWNDHAREAITAYSEGMSYSAPSATFSVGSPAMDQLYADMKQAAFLTAPGTSITDLDADWRRLPSWWRPVYNVRPGDTYALSKTGHVIQPFGTGFKPNNHTDLWPEVVNLHKVELNYEFTVEELNDLERNWLYRFNQPKGSANAFKMPFVQYIMSRLAEMRDNDVREALVSGVYAPNETEQPGFYLNSIEGLFVKIDNARGTKFRPFTDLGELNDVNVVDYINAFCQRMRDVLGSAPMVIYTTFEWVKRYRRYFADSLQTTIGQVPTYVQDYPHVELYALDYLRGNFMFATDRNNISIINGDRADEGALRAVAAIKTLQFAGQFNKGIHVGVFGKPFKSTDPVDWKLQRFFSNAEPIEYASVPAEADTATPSAKYGNIIQLGGNTTEVTITGIADATAGRPVTILGPTGNKAAKITTGDTFIGTEASYSLPFGSRIRLMPLVGGKFAVMDYEAVETAAKVIPLAPDTTAIPSPEDGQIFTTGVNTKATVIASIGDPAHPYDGFTITVRGAGGAENVSTMATVAGKIQLASAMTFNMGSELTLRLYGGVWYEINRKV